MTLATARLKWREVAHYWKQAAPNYSRDHDKNIETLGYTHISLCGLYSRRFFLTNWNLGGDCKICTRKNGSKPCPPLLGEVR